MTADADLAVKPTPARAAGGNAHDDGSSVVLARWFDRVQNFGDALTPYLIRRYTGVQPLNVLHAPRGRNLLRYRAHRREHRASLAQRLRGVPKPEYVCVGSILGWTDWAPEVQVIWGAGFMSNAACLRYPPRSITCVRGEKTLAQIPREWRHHINTLGDPGLLLGLFHARDESPAYRIGVVPHYTHHSLAATILGNASEDIRLINVQQSVPALMTDLASCETIVSSAMHGVIAADALGIPNRWVTFGDLPPGGTFKFHDYFSATPRFQQNPDFVDSLSAILAAARNADSTGTNYELVTSIQRCSPFCIAP